MNHVEDDIAAALCDWWTLSCRRHEIPEKMLMHIPNSGGYKGGYRSNMLRASRMKRQGVRAGVSDYFLAVARGRFHGLFLELKAAGVGVKRGSPTPEQIEFGGQVQVQDYRYIVAYGTDEAVQAVENYLAIGRTL